MPTPAQVALLDQIETANTELTTFIMSLPAPDLLAEVRCMIGRMMLDTAQKHARLSPPAITILALNDCLSRFDTDGGTLPDGETVAGWQPVPGAVSGSDDCLCHRDDLGGIRGRVVRIHELGHRLHDTTGYDGPINGL